ncbi:MAG: glycosyltransferase family 2 protein [Planctomycetota bacterium]
MAVTEDKSEVAPQPPAAPDAKPLARDQSQAVYERALATLDATEQIVADEKRRDDLATPPRLAVSVLMPVYNERETLLEIVARVRSVGLHRELIIVDDCSTDGTRDLLVELEREADIRVILHGYNRGKGAALRTAIEHARGDIVIIQDADLEYDPQDYAHLLEPIQRRVADVVYGSRFLENAEQDPSWWHRFGNRALTVASNLTTGLRLTDMETCYKAFRRDALRGMVLREERFGFEPEITAKLARRRCRFQELPVRYNSRGYEEGKKIGVRDGLRALWCIVRYAWLD